MPKLLLTILLAALPTLPLAAKFTIALPEPITLPAPTVDEIELISVRAFPGEKRLEIVAKAGDRTITAVRTGAEYDAVIAQLDVAMLTALFISDLQSAVAAMAAPSVTPSE